MSYKKNETVLIKKNSFKRKRKGFKYFDKFDIKKYYNNEEFQTFFINVFDDFRVTKKLTLIYKKLKRCYL